MLLQQDGSFQIAEAANGTEAIQKFHELKPDLILLDIGLPQVNGLDVARKLSPNARVLFLSQESSPDLVQAALGIGAGYVYKPDVQRELLPAIEAVLAGKRYVSSSLQFPGGAESQDLQDSTTLIFPLTPSVRST